VRKWTAFSFALLTAFVLAACSSTNSTTPDKTPVKTDGPSLSGQISNWPAGVAGTLGTLPQSSSAPSASSAFLTQTTIDSTGKFSLLLPSADKLKPLLASPPSTTFSPYLTCSGVTATAGVKGLTITFAVKATSQFSVGIVSFSALIPGQSGIPPFATYVYVDQDWSVSGVCIVQNSPNATVTLDIKAKSGWNTIIFSGIATPITISTGTPPSSFKWFVAPIQ
jgi:hypothetical protein